MLLDIPRFLGEIPARHKRRLPEGAALIASNATMTSGALSALWGRDMITDLGGPRQALFLDGSVWRSWSGAANIVPGPTKTDRLYVTGDGTPKMWANGTEYEMALPGPTAPPLLANQSATNPDRLETIHYAYTFVTGFGEESAPSPLSAALQWSEGVVVGLSAMQAPPAGRNITKLRIYRSQTSSYGETSLYFVDEIAAAASYLHDIAQKPLNEVIPTADFDTPPDDLAGIISMPNGMMVAHTAREIHFCEPFQPHAWPRKYSLTVDYDIVGLAAFGPHLAVMTAGTPYRGQGMEPDTFQLERIEENLPCTSARGIVDLGYAAAYPSTEGLVVVSASSGNVISKGLFTRTQWQALNPASIVASHFDGKYIFAFSGALPTGTEKTGIVDLSGEMPYFLRSGIRAQCFYHDIRTGKLYIQENDHRLYSWDDAASGTNQSLTWRSSQFNMNRKVAFSVVQIDGEDLGGGTFQADIIADGAVLHTITALNEPLRLPDGKFQFWEVEIRGQVEITSFALATSMHELSRRR